jgi:hypothetical protein
LNKAVNKKETKERLLGSNKLEPETSNLDYNHTLSVALLHYNSHYSLADYKEASLEYATSINLNMNRGIAEHLFRPTGAVSRLILRNCYIRPEDIQRNIEKLKQIQSDYDKTKLPDIITNVIQIKQLDYLVINFLNDIEDNLIDNILNNKSYKTEEYVKTYTTNEYSKFQSKEIISFINNKISYYDDVYKLLKGGCEQTKESFALTPSTRIKSVSKELKIVLDDILNVQHKEVVVKQVRAKKELSPLLQTSKMPYLKVWDKIEGLLPQAVIGCSEVWLFDTEKRDIIVLRALKDLKMNAKGFTFGNVDESKSFKKKLRKIEDLYLFTNTLETPTKKSLLATLNSIKTTEQVASGRMNEFKIILKGFK